MNDFELDSFLRYIHPGERESALEEQRTGFRGAGGDGDDLYIYDPEGWQGHDERGIKNIASFVVGEAGMPQYIRASIHSRFREVPAHRHDFVEINYLYSGRCANTVNGREINMLPGEFLVMDTNCSHSIGWMGADDILINLLVLPQHAQSAFWEMLTGNNALNDFLVTAVTKSSRLPNYIYFKTADNPVLKQTVKNLLREYLSPEASGADVLLNCYVRELVTLFMRECVDNPDSVEMAYRSDETIARILGYIMENCASCTRESTAAHFGYSPSYLSQLLTKSTGKSFVELRNDFRLSSIEWMLGTTTLPVKMIAEDYGFVNATHFYKLYRRHYGRNPRESPKSV